MPFNKNILLLLVLTTVQTKEDALTLCKKLVEEKLVACAQCIGPLTSSYVWENKYTERDEWQCQLKTTPKAFYSLEKRILELHPYSTPEVIALPITQTTAAYKNWVDSAVITS